MHDRRRPWPETVFFLRVCVYLFRWQRLPYQQKKTKKNVACHKISELVTSHNIALALVGSTIATFFRRRLFCWDTTSSSRNIPETSFDCNKPTETVFTEMLPIVAHTGPWSATRVHLHVDSQTSSSSDPIPWSEQTFLCICLVQFCASNSVTIYVSAATTSTKERKSLV